MTVFPAWHRSAKRSQDDGLNPFGTCIDEVHCATQGRIGNRRVILAGTNNYLGLTFDPQAIAAAQAALVEQALALPVRAWPTAVTAGTWHWSRSWRRSSSGHPPLSSPPVMSPTWAIISALATPKAVVLLDADCHASIYDACALGGAQIIRFRHNDAADLERRMVRLGEQAQACADHRRRHLQHAR